MEGIAYMLIQSLNIGSSFLDGSIFFLLLKYGLYKFNVATGDISILVAIGLFMEIIVLILL